MERTDAVRDLARASFVLITEAWQMMSRSFDTSRVGVLRLVAEQGPVRPSAISERLDMAPSSVTRQVQALEDAGHLVVALDPTDARTCLIKVTAAGLAELKQLETVGLATFNDVVADWNVRDMQILARLMRRLTEDWARRGPAARRRVRVSNMPRWRYRPRGLALPETDTPKGPS